MVIQKLIEIKEKYNIPWEMSEYSKRILFLWIDKTGGPELPPPPPSGGSGGSGPGGHSKLFS